MRKYRLVIDDLEADERIVTLYVHKLQIDGIEE